MGIRICPEEWRVRRVALLLRAAQSPVDSWTHLALVAHVHFQTPWYSAAIADLRLAMPTAKLMISEGPHGLFVHCHGYWSEFGEWISMQAHCIPLDMVGRRCHSSSDGLGRIGSNHVRCWTSIFRQQLHR
eukprot:8733598-Karenia_brevis.AAC.1